MTKNVLSVYLELIFKVVLVVMFAGVFFLFTNLTTEAFDTPKYLALLGFVGITLVVLTLKFTVEDKVVLLRTPLDLPLLLLLAVAVISTIFSSSPFISLLGHQGKINGSLVALVSYILFYFLYVNNLKSFKEVRLVINLLFGAGAILSSITLLSYFGINFLPSDWNQTVNFTPTGSSFSTTAILAMLLPLLVVEILSSKGVSVLSEIPRLGIYLIYGLLLALFGITIVLTGGVASFIAGISALGLTILASKPNLKQINWIFVAVPTALAILLAVLSFVPPVGGAQNPLYERAKNFPREVQLDFLTSWKVSVSAFRDNPFWGTGPSTHLFNFTLYKPIEFNNSTFWNIRFEQSFNEYLQVLGTLGGIGLLALISVTLLFIGAAWKTIRLDKTLEQPQSPVNRLSTGLAISGLTFIIILIFHTATLPVWVVGLTILGSFMVVNFLREGPARSLFGGFGENIGQNILRVAANISSTRSSEEVVRINALPGVLLVIGLALTLFAFFYGGKFAVADYYHRQAILAIGRNDGLAAYNAFVEAENRNPYNDLYRINIAQTNFALANAIATAKAPTPENPQGTLTDEDRQNIQVLLQQAINEGRTAVTLSPRSVANWEVLATLYRQIAGVAENALLFSLDSYGRAIFQDPLNPLLRLGVGGTYYAVQNYDLAIRFFTDAINLKPDFANAYYNLSVAMRDKGDLVNAQAAAERMLSLLEADSDDYRVGTDYLNDLKNRISPPSPQQPPAAETEGALEADVNVEVGQPQEIATPSAVKRPNATPEPSPTP